MGTTETVDYYGGYLYSDFAGAIAKMLADYTEDDLTELLCECEMLLQTNDIYLKKLNETGLKKLFYLVTGIESACNCRLRDNFQLLHKITLEVEKKILSRFSNLTDLIRKLREKQASDNSYLQYCINFLKQKVDAQKRKIDAIEVKVALMHWEQYEIEQYISESDTRKVMQIASDIYTITGGSCECGREILESALKKLGVFNANISPIDFVQEIMRNLECLPLYIKDEETYNIERSDFSRYGSVIYQIRNLVIDQNIQELATAKKETLDNLCLPLLKESIEEKEMAVTNASLICWQLLGDMKEMHTRIMTEQERLLRIEEKAKELRDAKAKELRDAEEKERQRQEEEREKQKKYSLLLVSPSNMLECSLDGYMEDSFEPTTNYGIDEKNLDYAKKRISSFSPAIIVKPDKMAKTDLVIRSDKIHTASLADFYFCLWYISPKRDKSVKSIALLDYYEKNLYVSCYKIENGDQVSKEVPFEIKACKTRKHIIDAIKEKFFKDVPDKEITLFRIFESEKYLDKKLEKVDAPFIKLSWRDLLKSKLEREAVFKYFYKFEQEALLRR